MSRHRDRWIGAREIADIRRLQLQQAVGDAARSRAALDAGRERLRLAEADHDAQLQAWRAALAGPTLPLALLANGRAALVPARARCEAAAREVESRTEALDTARQRLRQRDRLAEAAQDLASHEAARHRRMLDEQRMSELEIRLALHGDAS
ncbi:hypothetical protein [Burkholderia gladioli]|uniref:hypothetical protein n=1 Tax=Burkholderia gladioli TaxID=28095 RepID=UPI00163EE7ED|nr:hypothetical protein [Burkholderia gladioli]